METCRKRKKTQTMDIEYRKITEFPRGTLAIRANCEYPGEWDGEIERIENAGDVVITGMMVKHHNGVRKCTLADQSNKSCLFGR